MSHFQLAKSMALVGMVFAATTGCRPQDATVKASDAALVCYAGIPPVQDFVERIGGEHIQVRTLLGPGQSPHTFEPTPKLVADACSARALFTVGLPFESQLAKRLTNTAPDLTVIDLRSNVIFRKLEAGEVVGGHAHDHDHSQCSHEHGELDPHIWMSPRVAITLARDILNGLKQLDPAHATEYESNANAWITQLSALDADLRKELAPYEGRAIFVFHPAYGYLADAYGLRQIAIESEGKQPAAKELASLVSLARTEHIRALLVQPQMDKRNATTIAREIGATVVSADPLAKDYVANLKSIGTSIAQAMAESDRLAAGNAEASTQESTE